MKTVNQVDFTGALSILFRETFERMPTPEEQVYRDRDAGIFMTLGKIDAQQASTEINSNTIASHCEQARFYLELLDNYLNSDFRILDFRQSWRVTTVSEDMGTNCAKTYRELTGRPAKH